MAYDPLSGPIPGENYTSDTKNYAWHRPPEHDSLDTAMEDILTKLLDEENTGALTMIESGVTIAELTQIILMSGIMAGKWTLDYALLLAGPTAHVLYLMAKAYEIDCDMGIDKGFKPITSNFITELRAPKGEPLPEETKAQITSEVTGTGFMAGAPKTAEAGGY